MFAIIGLVVVLGAVLSGYLMEHGQLKVLLQPPELVIIGGAGLGTLLIANPLSTILRIAKGMTEVLKGSKYNQAFYLSSLKMLSDLFMLARKQGIVKLEEASKTLPKARSSRNIRSFSPIIMRHLSFATRCACDQRRSCTSRFGSDDGGGYGGPSSRGLATGERADQRGGFAAGTGNRGGGARRSRYHGCAGRATGRDRP